MEEHRRLKYGITASICGITINFLLATLKLVAGILCASISVIADSINNYSDMASSLINLVGFRLSGKPGDAEHPYGHRRMEYITGLIMSVVVLAVGIELLYSSVSGMLNPSRIEISILLVIILIVSILMKIFLSFLYFFFYRKTKSVALKALIADSRNDAITTSVVLAGVIVQHYTGFLYTDGIAGTFVSLFILYSGIGILKEAINPLLGEKLDKETFTSVINDIKGHKGILGVHDVTCHVYGVGETFMTLHAEISSFLSFEEAHDITDECEKEILSKYKIHLLIHADPTDSENPMENHLKEQVTSILKEIDANLFPHDFHFREENGKMNISFECQKPQNEKILDREILSTVKEKLGPLYFVSIGFEYGYTDLEETNEMR